jgi:soluble lytic murein transglycosylase-like protein
MAAAYNAGEEQTAVWQRFCHTAEPEELLAKIGFGETRAYVARVLESRNAYRALAAVH